MKTRMLLGIPALLLACLMSAPASAVTPHDCDRMFGERPRRHAECMHRAMAEERRLQRMEERRRLMEERRMRHAERRREMERRRHEAWRHRHGRP